jgi:hypothetical protein
VEKYVNRITFFLLMRSCRAGRGGAAGSRKSSHLLRRCGAQGCRRRTGTDFAIGGGDVSDGEQSAGRGNVAGTMSISDCSSNRQP